MDLHYLPPQVNLGFRATGVARARILPVRSRQVPVGVPLRCKQLIQSRPGG